MLVSVSGRGVPPNPGCVGVKTWAWRAVLRSWAKAATETGPAPPCSNRNGAPLPCSATVTWTGPNGAVMIRVFVVISISLYTHVDTRKLFRQLGHRVRRRPAGPAAPRVEGYRDEHDPAAARILHNDPSFRGLAGWAALILAGRSA